MKTINAGFAIAYTLKIVYSLFLFYKNMCLQSGVMSRADAMRCYVQCSSSSLAVPDGAIQGKVLMMDELSLGLGDRTTLEDSHYAQTAIRSGYQQAFGPSIKQGTVAY